MIGASGFIGKKLFNVGNRQAGIKIFGTSFSNDNEKLLTLDVRKC